MTLNRRHVILAAAALAVPAAARAEADLTKLNDAPKLGEMALGKDDAKVTVIEYASASCPHCAAFYNDHFAALQKDYIDTGKVRFIFREFPHNQPALAAFMLARCAPKEKYFPMVDMFFAQQQMWMAAPADGLFKIAQLAGMTKDQFDACLKNEEVAKAIIEGREQAERDFGVTGIPTFFVNGQRYDGDYTMDGLKAVIDPLLG